MVNSTVNGKKIGKAAGYKDKVSIGYIVTHQTTKGLEVDNSTENILSHIKSEDIVRITDEYVVMKAYPGGNPNKVKENKKDEELTH